MITERITTLFSRYMDGSATAAEQYELAALALQSAHRPLIKLLEEEYWEKMKEEAGNLADGEIEKLMFKVGSLQKIPLRILYWRRIAIAASILLVVGLGSYFLVNSERSKGHGDKKVAVNNDVIAPATNKAMITLADGRTVALESVDAGTLAQQSNVTVTKTADGKIIYEVASAMPRNDKIVYNTLSNPRGSKVIDMTLADGSHVWLNAGSSVTYPVAFVGNERKVSITGEAYFEVAHDRSKPFFVSNGEMNIQVLGTKFNVNAYDDETVVKVTLLEGSVKVAANNNRVVIKPGEQATVSNAVSVNKNVNVEEVMAWKNGRFQFEVAGIEDMMRQIARWYDVEVIYEAKPGNLHFTGGISREVEASKVLKMLETTEAVHFRIEGKKVFVIR